VGRNGPWGRDAEPGRVGRSGGAEPRDGPGVRSGVEGDGGGAAGVAGGSAGAAEGSEAVGRTGGGAVGRERRSSGADRAWTSGAGQTVGPVCCEEPSGGGGSKAGTDADRTLVEASAVAEDSISTSGLRPPRRSESRRNSEGRSGPAPAGDGPLVVGDPAGRALGGSDVLDLGPRGVSGPWAGWSPDWGSAERRGSAPGWWRPSELGSSPSAPEG
jgi:hypothetical protein